MDSLILYAIVVALSVAFFSFGSKRNFKPFIFIGLIIPVLYASIRSYVGTDFGTYVVMHQEMSHISFVDFMTRHSIEPTFYWMSVLSEYITHSPFLFFSISSLVTVLFFYLGLRKYISKQLGVPYFLFLLLVFPVTLNLVRQGVALAIVFYAFTFIIDRNFKKYVWWMIAATLFHYSAIILLPMYLMNRVVIRKLDNRANQARVLAVAMGVALILPVGLMLLRYLPLLDKYVTYVQNDAAGANIQFYIKFAIALLVSLIIRLSTEKKNYALMFIYAFSMIEVSLMFNGFFLDITRRVSTYLLTFSILLLPMALATIPPGYLRSFGKISIVAYAILVFVLLYIVADVGQIFPYETIFTRGYYN